MAVVDFILNLAGLLLWLNWRSNRFDPLVKRMPATLMGTLRPASPKKFRRWQFFVLIAALLGTRALIYYWIGTMAPKVWVAQLNLGLTTLPFRSDQLIRMLIFSFCSFGLVLWVFYIWLLALSLLAGPMPLHALVTIPLGRVDQWPLWAKALLPFLGSALAWWLAGFLLAHLNIVPPISSAGHFQQAFLLGISGYLLWQYPIGAILILRLLNSYIYFGKHPLWRYVDATAQTILRPFDRLPLRVGRLDFAPLVGIILIFAVANCMEFGIKTSHRIGENGRPLPPLVNVPGLVDLYGKLPL